MAALLTLDPLDSDNEFGYDFTPEDEEALIQLASADTGLANPRHSPAGSAIDAVPGKTDTVAGDDVVVPENARAHAPRKLRGRGPVSEVCDGRAAQPRTLPSPVSFNESVTYPDLSRALSDVGKEPKPQDLAPIGPANNSVDRDPENGDDRTPLQKFRSFPRKPFSVSDLTSGAWCELQYEYTLTRLPGGRRTRTQAMRQGSKVHQQLEDEVHTTVKVDIMTREDGFGLRLWNLVQGLRTLRDTGLTRELEVWGMVDGNLVNGVIDSVSYENPNPEFEQELSSQESQLDPSQPKLVDYFPPKKKGKHTQPRPKIYLTDVKTRGSTAPVSNPVIRPAKIQLLLYHRFLSDMAAEELDYFAVCDRYGLDVDSPFSDSFIAQIGALHDEIFVDAPLSSGEQPSSSFTQSEATTTNTESDPPLSTPDLVKYHNLRELISLVKEEVRLAFPDGEDSLGHMLRVQYVHRSDGRDLDLHDFPVAKQALEEYLDRYMAWWHGERPAKGVDIEEAFKCQSCEFAADCSWREGLNDVLVQRARHKSLARRNSKRA